MEESTALNIQDAWHSVALEERFELISRSQSYGIVASAMFFFLMGAVGYGFDQIWILAAGAVGCTFIMPLFANYSWRKLQPALILEYLAVRSVARRYAFARNVKRLDVVLIFRGYLENVYDSEEQKQLALQAEEVDFEHPVHKATEVWVCLMRGAIVMLSEKLGGARLEFLTSIDDMVGISRTNGSDDSTENALLIEGSVSDGGRNVVLISDYPGALYVFEKKVERLIEEVKQEKAERLKVRTSEVQLGSDAGLGVDQFLGISG